MELPDNFDVAVARITEVVLREGECMAVGVPDELHKPLRRAIIKSVKAQVGGTMQTMSIGPNVWAVNRLVYDAMSDAERMERNARLMATMDAMMTGDAETAKEMADANRALWKVRWYDALAY